jgi:putative membrane protein insertion efficiency factor
MIQRLLITVLRGYRLLLSSWLGSQCRFAPTCSVYSIEAIERHGAAIGSYLMVRRVARCHPWCDGGVDPVPHERPRLFAHLPTAQRDRSTSRPRNPA